MMAVLPTTNNTTTLRSTNTDTDTNADSSDNDDSTSNMCKNHHDIVKRC